MLPSIEVLESHNPLSNGSWPREWRNTPILIQYVTSDFLLVMKAGSTSLCHLRSIGFGVCYLQAEKKEYEEKYKQQWKTLLDFKRVKWIKKAILDEQRYLVSVGLL